MGDSTKRRMAAAIQGGAGLGGTRTGFNPGASVGGYAGGMGGTFGKAGRGLDPSLDVGVAGAAASGSPASGRPPSAGRSQTPVGGGGGSPAPLWMGGNSPGGGRDPIPRYFPDGALSGDVRPKQRPPSTISKSVWEHHKELPKAPSPGTTTGYVRPKSATARPAPSGGVVQPMEYRLVGTGLEANRGERCFKA